MAKTKKSKYDHMQLIDHCHMEVNITCSRCSDASTEHNMDDFYATEQFFEKGWRATKSGKVYCPECAKKKLKL